MNLIFSLSRLNSNSNLIFEDLVSLENVRNVSQVELLASLLPNRVGSLLSINNLSTYLQVAFEITKKWVSMLVNLSSCVFAYPHRPTPDCVSLKRKKVHMWDWSLCQNESARYENMLASDLLKFCHLWEDAKAEEIGL